MKYVLDSSVGLKWSLAEGDSHIAIRLRDDYCNGVHDLLSPDIFPPEVANALASAERQVANALASAERQGRIKAGQSAIFLNDILSTAPMIHPSPPHLLRAMEIAVSWKQAVYDCLYLALAEQEQCEMVTADDQFHRKMRSDFPFLVRLADLP